MKRPFKKGDRVRLNDRTGTVLDEVTHDWLDDVFQVLDIRIDGADGISIRISDTNVHHLEEETSCP